MDNLRLILLLVGAAIVVLVYLVSRHHRQSSDENESEHAPRRSPVFEDDMPVDEEDRFDDDDLPAFSAGPSSRDEFFAETLPATDARELQHQKPARKEKIIVLNILPQDRTDRFSGADLMDIFDRAGLEYGQFDVFHRMIEINQEPRSVFSIASATEPGAFDIVEMADKFYKGLSMFMLLPGPQGGVAAFADMLATARRIAQQLNGEVLDQQRSTLTRQTARHIREQIIEFETSLRGDRFEP